MTEYAKALAEFKASRDWITAADPVSLGASVAMQRFLENRILTAFQAGWLAGRLAMQASAIDQYEMEIE